MRKPVRCILYWQKILMESVRKNGKWKGGAKKETRPVYDRIYRSLTLLLCVKHVFPAYVKTTHTTDLTECVL